MRVNWCCPGAVTSLSEHEFRAAEWAPRVGEEAPVPPVFRTSDWARVTPSPYRIWEATPADAADCAQHPDDAGPSYATVSDSPVEAGPTVPAAYSAADSCAAAGACSTEAGPVEASRAADTERGLLEPLPQSGSALQACAGVLAAPDAEMIAAARQTGFDEGLTAGRTEALSALSDERALLRRIAAATESAAQRPDVLFEPLKWLALHIAQELVRCELSLSTHAIDHLVRGCLAAIDQPGAKIIVSLNPDDFRMMTSGPSVERALTFDSDASLSAGSVRVRANDTRVLDFIEHRLRSLAETLLSDAQPGSPQ